MITRVGLSALMICLLAGGVPSASVPPKQPAKPTPRLAITVMPPRYLVATFLVLGPDGRMIFVDTQGRKLAIPPRTLRTLPVMRPAATLPARR